MSATHWFWFSAGISIASLIVVISDVTRRRYFAALTFGLIASLWIGLAVIGWSEAYGECEGKGGTVVSMLKALNLCRGQSTTVPLRMPQPDQRI